MQIVFEKMSLEACRLQQLYMTSAKMHPHSLLLLVSSADNLCKQFGARPAGPDQDKTLMVFLKEFFEEKVDFEKLCRRQKKDAKLPSKQIVKFILTFSIYSNKFNVI